MDARTFLQQVHRKMIAQGITGAELKEACIDVYDNKMVIFKVDNKGNMFYSSDKKIESLVDGLHEKIQPIVCEVDEYLKVMTDSPDLVARDFNMSYKKITEFNGVVLGGIEHKNGDFEFATWSTGQGALYHGHYFKDYTKAKEDFVVRSGLIQSTKLFNGKEMMQIYRCTEDTLNNGYELTDEQAEILEEIQEKVKQAVPNFIAKLQEEIDMECEQEMG